MWLPCWRATDSGLASEYRGEIVAVGQTVLRRQRGQRGQRLHHSGLLWQQQRLRVAQGRIGVETLSAGDYFEVAVSEFIAVQLQAAVNRHGIFRQIPGQKTSPGIFIEEWLRQTMIADEVARL